MWLRKRLKENQKELKRRARRKIAKRIFMTSGTIALISGIISKMRGKGKYTITS